MGKIISLTEAKIFMQITNTVSDILIDAYIEMIEGEIDAYTNRTLGLATYTETLTALQSTFDVSSTQFVNAYDSTYQLFLNNYPISSLSLTSNGNTVTSTSYNYNAQNGVVNPNYQLGGATATYVAGYTTITAPAALKAVIKLGVTSLFNNNGIASSSSGNVKSKKIKDFSVEYGDAASGYLAVSDGLLAKSYIVSNSVVLGHYKKHTI